MLHALEKDIFRQKKKDIHKKIAQIAIFLRILDYTGLHIPIAQKYLHH